MEYVSKTDYGEAYYNHEVFELIKHMQDYCDGIAYTCYGFIPNGTLGAVNYSSYVFSSIRTTLESIRGLLKEGHIADAFVLIRRLFDTVLVDIYLNVVREEKYDWEENLVVKDVDDWIKRKIRIPRVKKILDLLNDKGLVPFLWVGQLFEEEQRFVG